MLNIVPCEIQMKVIKVIHGESFQLIVTEFWLGDKFSIVGHYGNNSTEH